MCNIASRPERLYRLVASLTLRHSHPSTSWRSRSCSVMSVSTWLGSSFIM